jgi:CRISPR-associated protein Cas1
VVTENPCSLRLDKGRLQIVQQSGITATVPLEDLGVLVLDYNQITVTVPLLAALAEAEVAVLVTGSKHLPVATYLPVAAHHQHALIIRRQAEAGEATKKRVWQQIVQAKIRNQAAALEALTPRKGTLAGAKDLRSMARKVASGDTGNLEAVAASRYFPILFGPGFRREPELGDLSNAMLNYGYALVRAAVARAVCGSGLHPAFGVFHHNRYDHFALADDAMEPLRPLIDTLVRRYEGPAADSLSPSIKRYLYPVLTSTVTLAGERLPLLAALERYAANLRRCILAEAKKLSCPELSLTGHESSTR